MNFFYYCICFYFLDCIHIFTGFCFCGNLWQCPYKLHFACDFFQVSPIWDQFFISFSAWDYYPTSKICLDITFLCVGGSGGFWRLPSYHQGKRHVSRMLFWVSGFHSCHSWRKILVLWGDFGFNRSPYLVSVLYLPSELGRRSSSS